jgi:predicted PurR-regulated permease PerM
MAGAAAIAVSSGLLVTLAWRTVKGALLIGFLAVVFAYLVAPAALGLRRLAERRRWKLSRRASVLVVYGLAALAGLAVRALLWPRLSQQIGRFIDLVPAHVEATVGPTGVLQHFVTWLAGGGQPTGTLATTVQGLALWVREHVADVMADAAAQRWVLPWLGLVPLLAYVLLTEFPWFRRSALAALPAGHLRWRGGEFLAHVNSVLAGYTRAQLLSCLIVGAASAVGLAWLQVPYALLVGVAAGVLEFVPLVGPVTAALLAASLVSGRTLVGVLVFLVAIRLVQDYLVYPRLLGRRMHLPPLAVLLAVGLGAAAGGFVGVLFALPLAGVLAVAWRHWREWRDIQAIIRDYDRRQAERAARET